MGVTPHPGSGSGTFPLFSLQIAKIQLTGVRKRTDLKSFGSWTIDCGAVRALGPAQAASAARAAANASSTKGPSIRASACAVGRGGPAGSVA
jgi:hypothetical protein